jgi:hypothetical protein
MARTTVIREVFPSRDEAEAARDRLTDHGISLTNISMTGSGGPCELIVRTHPEDRHRAEQAIHESWWAHEAHQYGRQLYEHAPSRGQSFLLLGAIAAAGVGLAWAFTRTHHEQNYRPRVTTRRNREGGYRDTAAPRWEVDRGYNVERRRTDVTSDDERLRTASGAVPLSTTPGGPSSGGIGSAGSSGADRTAEGIGAAGDGSRPGVR